MHVTPGHPVGTAFRECEHLRGLLPGRLGGLHARRTAPASTLTFAWGSPAVTLTCGVPKPPGYSASSSQTIDVDGVRWFQEVESSDVVWTAIRPGGMAGRHVFVALRVPTRYTASDVFLTQLARPLAAAVARGQRRPVPLRTASSMRRVTNDG